MPRNNFTNQWGAMGSNMDPQRADLYRVVINLPIGGSGAWSNAVEFAVEAFPFPEQSVETFAIKRLQQTNHILGGDTATRPVDIKVRYAFNQATAQALYRWFYLISNPRTGGTAATSVVKASGRFYWMIPDMDKQFNVDATTNDVLKDGLTYQLEGCLITGLKPSDADHSQGNQQVHLMFNLLVDRYYPISGTLINSTGGPAVGRDPIL